MAHRLRWAQVATLVLGMGLGCDDDAEHAEHGDDPPVPAMRVGEPLGVSYTLLPLYAEGQSSGASSPVADAGDGAGVRIVDPVYECEELPLGDCDGNTAPVLRDPLYVINDLLVPDLSDVRNGDHLSVLVAFEDEECNLACGTNRSSSASSTSAASAPSNIPCSTEESGMHLGLHADVATVSGPNVEDKAPEDYSYQLSVSDRCGARSEPVVVEFTVTF